MAFLSYRKEDFSAIFRFNLLSANMSAVCQRSIIREEAPLSDHSARSTKVGRVLRRNNLAKKLQNCPSALSMLLSDGQETIHENP